MFPIFELESQFQDHSMGELDPESLFDLGKLCQQWLLSFADQENPAQVAAQQINSTKEDEISHRIVFALAASLCAPGKDAAQVIQSYKGYVNDNSWLLRKWVAAMTETIHPHHPVDILVTFDALESTDLYETARSAYGISMQDVRWDAAAWDNLKIFEGTLPQTGADDSVFNAMAMFTVDPESAIHRRFVCTEEDEKKLFTARLNRMRTQLIFGYNNGYASMRQYGEKRPTLVSEMVNLGGTPSMDDTIPLHKEPGFTQALLRDADNSIELFFQNQKEKLYINTESWKYVDEITQAFLDAGLNPEKMMFHGPWKEGDAFQWRPLDKALSHFGQMDMNNQRFYSHLFKAYLATFEIDDIIDNCTGPESLAAVYQVTGNKAFLQAGDSKVRELIMGSDLGL
ncbi:MULTISPECIES: hypothetical protein [Pseudomonas]|uniref:hypothetical protein n=1 Tax=Pseudomonas TaxID=286 RepID=UPI000F02943E|nr:MULTISPECIES: hypothetical protein [Pseudomonas]MBD8615435.1 hypothetical protein [Pseudomonas putida]MBD8681912.1 hypothetical protein [Pseudomonas sp. CFBP 13719]